MSAGRRAVAVASLAILGTVAGCRGKAAPVGAQPLMDAFHERAHEEGLSREQTSGKRLFAHYCATCHGDTGGGDGQNAYNLEPSPPDLRDTLGQHPRSYWRQVIEGGTAAVGRSPLCPPWGRSLAGDEVDSLLAYLDELARPQPPAGGAAAAGHGPAGDSRPQPGSSP